MCILAVDCADLQDKLGQNIDLKTLDKIVEPRLLKREKGVQTVKLIFFEDVVSPTVKGILKPLKDIGRSNIFLKLWSSVGKTLHKRIGGGIALSLDQVAIDVWHNAYSKVQDIYKRLASGDMPLREVKKLFEDIGSDQEQIKEIRILGDGDNTEWMAERMEQMKRYKRLKDFHRGAHAMLRAAGTLELTGNFLTLSNILDIVSRIHIK